jgi:hypothetical protein
VNSNAALGQQGYDWLDSDWGFRNPATATQSGTKGWLTGDQAFGDNSGNGAGTGPSGDGSDCAFLDVFSGNGISSNSAYNKLHIEGMVYAPSGAVQLAGRDNRAPWITAGTIARQVTALRWKSGGDNSPAFGNTTPDHNDRFIEIDVCAHGADCSIAANVVLREYVQISDYNGTDVGGKVTVLSYLPKPPS